MKCREFASLAFVQQEVGFTECVSRSLYEVRRAMACGSRAVRSDSGIIYLLREVAMARHVR